RSHALVVAAHLAAFLAFSTFAFLRSLNELFILLDGTYTLTIAAHQFAWLPPAAGYFASPFQGLGDVWFPINSWLIPGFLLPHLVPHAVTAISETCLIVAAIAALGRAKDRPGNLSWRDVLLILALLALAGHLTLSLSASVILCLPVVVFGAAGCIAGAE